jgi:hypothetical protein
MKFLCSYIAVSIVSVVMLATLSAKADFGAADVGGKNNEARTFEAWCAKKGNTCKVTFGENSISVNDKDSVPYARVKNFRYSEDKWGCDLRGIWCMGRSYSFDIIYTKNDGTESVGKIIFAKESVALSFMQNIKAATGNKPWAGDPRCSNGEVFYEGICLAPSNAAEVRTREKESINASEAVKEHGRAIGAGLAVQGELQKQGLQSAGESIQQGLGNVKVQQNTGVIIVPR